MGSHEVLCVEEPLVVWWQEDVTLEKETKIVWDGCQEEGVLLRFLNTGTEKAEIKQTHHVLITYNYLKQHLKEVWEFLLGNA